MTLVLLGTQNNSFHRLLEEVQKNIDNGKIKEDIVKTQFIKKFNFSDFCFPIYSNLPFLNSNL